MTIRSALAANGRFEVLRQIGSGGTGDVWEAEDLRRQVRVALKSLRHSTPEQVLRLKREFRVAELVNHPHVVTPEELFCEQGLWFYSMELIEGVDFLAYLRPGGALDVHRARACLIQLVSAVDALHAAGLLHRDLKPSNVMVSHEGRLAVLDLGMIGLGDDPAERAVAGTPAYMAPEQAAGRRLGPPADWYSIGAMLYEALAGKPPFEGAPMAILVDKQRTTPPPLPADRLPPDLVRLAHGLLAIDPRDRPDPRLAVGTAMRDTRSGVTLEQGALFVGRRAQLAELDGVLERTPRGLELVVVAGESGVGKSALVQDFAAGAAARHDAVVLRARCHEREAVPGGGIDGVIDALANCLRQLDDTAVSRFLPNRTEELARAFPVLRTIGAVQRLRRTEEVVADPHTRRARVIGAITESLARIADRRRLIVVIDDLQWADAETLATLSGIVGSPDAPSMLLIATWRPLAPDLAPPAPFAAAPTIRLEPLDPDDAAELARALLKRVGHATTNAAELARESGGHPLLLDLLVDHHLCLDRGALRGASLRDALSARIERLDLDPRVVLDTLAVGGGPCTEPVLTRVTGLPAVRVARAIAALRAAHLARRARAGGDDAPLEVYHHQVAAATLSLMSDGLRQSLHLAFVNALESAGNADPEILASHLEAAGEHETAARYAIEAATAAAASQAFHRAARLWSVAITLGGAGRLDECRLGRGEALSAIGRGAAAAADFLAVAGTTGAQEALDLRRHAAQQLLVTGHTAEGLAQIREILEHEGLGFPATSRRAVAAIAWRRLRLRFGRGFRTRDPRDLSQRQLDRIDVCWHVALGLSIVDTMRGHAFHALGLRLARHAGEPRRYARALALDIAYRGIAGSPVTATVEDQYARARQLADQIGDDHARGLAIGCRGVAAFLRGDWRDGASWCQEAETILTERCAGVPWELATAKLFAGRALLALGDLTGLAARVDADIRECRDRGDLYGETSLRAALLPFVALARGSPQAALRAADDALASWTPIGYQIQHYYQLVSRCHVDLYDGSAAAIAVAAERLREGLGAVRRSMFVRIQMVRITLADLGGASLWPRPAPTCAPWSTTLARSSANACRGRRPSPRRYAPARSGGEAIARARSSCSVVPPLASMARR